MGIEDPDVQYCSFDWLNTNWQYCAFPVTIRKELGLVEEIKVFFDYTNNTNTAEFFGMSLKEGKWEYEEFDGNKLKTYSESSLDKTYTTYEYNEDKKLIKETTYKNGTPYTTKYQYNTAGSLVRSICGDIVNENIYNDKGSVIKSFTYNKNNPSCKLYSAEEQLDEKGQSNTSVNSFGEVVETSTYSNDTGLLEYTTNENGQVTAYGYDYEDDTLLSTTTTIDGEENHTIYGYEDDLLKSLSHNDFAYSFEHDQYGRIIKTKIADSDYSTTTYEDITETQTINNVATEVVVGERITTTMQPSKEKFVVEKNLQGNIYLAKYINSNNVEFKILENIYDTYGNLVSTKDYSNSQDTPVEYQVFLDKYQNIFKKTYTLHNTAVEISNSETETSKTTTFKLGTNTYATTQNLSDDLDATLQSVTLPGGLTQTVGYDGLKRIHETNLGNIYSKCYNYLQKGDHASNLVASEWFAQDGVYKDSLKYAYDKKGNIVSIKSNGELIASYEYDELSRLTRENNKLLNKTTTFSYDKGGNIIQQKEYTYSTLETQKLSGGESKTYAYRSNGWKDQLVSFNGSEIIYDSIGNPEKYKGNTLTWVKGRQLQSFGGKTFAYNASGIRISKTANGVITNFFLDGTKILAQQSSNGTLVFLHGADGVIGFIHNSTNYYYKKNIQGDIIAILNANGQEIAKYTYDAWGNHKIHYLEGTNFVAINSNVCYNSSDPVNKQIATLNPFRYRGYYFDCETGLYYLNSRYYDPETGRFINADDISVLDLTNVAINGLNLYAYCLNNPVNEVDETGYFLWWIPVIIAAAVAITTVTVVTSIASQSKKGKVNWLLVAFQGILALASVLLMVTGLGPLGIALWNGAFSFVGTIGEQLMTEGKINFGQLLFTTALSIFTGGIGKGGANNMRAIRKALIKNDDYFKATQSQMKVLYKSNNGLYKTIQGELAAKRNVNARIDYLKQKIGYFEFLKRFSKSALLSTLKPVANGLFNSYIML